MKWRAISARPSLSLTSHTLRAKVKMELEVLRMELEVTEVSSRLWLKHSCAKNRQARPIINRYQQRCSSTQLSPLSC